jgi:hypothetical protein
MDLIPHSGPPSRFARWCPSCLVWLEPMVWRGRRRCPTCGSALVRPSLPVKPRPGELRPGIIAEFNDPRDATLGTTTLAKIRAQLQEPHR